MMGAAIYPRHLVSSGAAMIGLTKDPRFGDGRMRALMCLTDLRGREWQIHLSPVELRAMLQDTLKLLVADEAEVRRWWRALTADDDVPGTTYPRER